MKAYICVSRYYDKGQYKNSPKIHLHKEDAIKALNRCLARTMICLTKKPFSIYSRQNDTSQYDYIAMGDKILIFKYNTSGWKIYRVFQIVEIELPYFVT